MSEEELTELGDWAVSYRGATPASKQAIEALVAEARRARASEARLEKERDAALEQVRVLKRALEAVCGLRTAADCEDVARAALAATAKGDT